MNKAKKVWLIIASSLAAVGLLVFAVAMSCLKWNFKNLSTVKYTTNEYTITETYNSISITTDTADITLLPAEDETTSIVCHEREKETHSVRVQDGVLVVSETNPNQWNGFFSIDFNSPTITLSLPLEVYETLTIKASTSDVKIHKDFIFSNIDVKTSTGNVENYATAANLIKIKTSTGNICLKDTTAKALDLAVSTGKVTVSNVDCSEDIKISVSTGDVSLNDVTCKSLTSTGDTGDISMKNVIATEKFSIERDTGDVKFNACDAAEIFVETDTGDVTGTLLSAKVFDVDTDTGRVNVPNSSTGGRCEISTDTGDIIISIL